MAPKEKDEPTAAPDPLLLAPLLAGQRFLGVIRSYNSNSGFGFIACAETRQIFGRDVFIQRQEVEPSGATVGATVSFTVELRLPDNKPQARNVQVEAPGMGTKSKGADVMQLLSDLLTEVATQVLGKTYLGIIKTYDPAAAIGLISSEEISKVFGVDAVFQQLPPGLKVGDACQFKLDIDLEKGTPNAQSVGTAPEGALDKLAMDMMGSSTMHLGQVGGVLPGLGCGVHATIGPLGPTALGLAAPQLYTAEPQGMAPLGCFLFGIGGDEVGQGKLQSMFDEAIKQDVKPEVQPKKQKVDFKKKQRFVGILRSFNRARGFGFIACDETYSMFGSDVFLHNEQRDGFEVGDVISFALEPRGQHARAKDLRGAANPQDRGCTPSRSPDRDGRHHRLRGGNRLPPGEDRQRSRSCSRRRRKWRSRSRGSSG